MELGFQGCGRTTGTPISGFFRKFWFRAFGFGVLGVVFGDLEFMFRGCGRFGWHCILEGT